MEDPPESNAILRSARRVSIEIAAGIATTPRARCGSA